MSIVWYEQNRAAVLAALGRGERPDMATTMASGPLDELVALHEELGVLAALEEVKSTRERVGVPDVLLLRTLAPLPFVAAAAWSGAVGALFREPAILLQLGGAPVQIRQGSNRRHRHPDGRQVESLPCHPDTLRDALRRVGVAAWGWPRGSRCSGPECRRCTRGGVQALYARRLVQGGVDAIDGSGRGPHLRVVALVCVSATRPVIVAWRGGCWKGLPRRKARRRP